MIEIILWQDGIPSIANWMTGRDSPKKISALICALAFSRLVDNSLSHARREAPMIGRLIPSSFFMSFPAFPVKPNPLPSTSVSPPTVPVTEITVLCCLICCHTFRVRSSYFFPCVYRNYRSPWAHTRFVLKLSFPLTLYFPGRTIPAPPLSPLPQKG